MTRIHQKAISGECITVCSEFVEPRQFLVGVFRERPPSPCWFSFTYTHGEAHYQAAEEAFRRAEAKLKEEKTMTREASTSITQLVKTVAGEVIAEALTKDVRISTLADRMAIVEQELGLAPENFSEIENHPQIKYLATKAGAKWDAGEEFQLAGELDKAIRWMASIHERTTGSIHARLRKLLSNDSV